MKSKENKYVENIKLRKEIAVIKYKSRIKICSLNDRQTDKLFLESILDDQTNLDEKRTRSLS